MLKTSCAYFRSPAAANVRVRQCRRFAERSRLYAFSRVKNVASHEKLVTMKKHRDMSGGNAFFEEP
jgi:hypothetical protein